jgi:cytochrome c biogenesis protein CcdA
VAGGLNAYKQARVSLGAGVSAMVLGLVLLGAASLGVSCPGRPQPSGPQILEIARQQSGLAFIVIAVLMIVAALAAIVLGVGARRRKAEDPRISGRATAGIVLGIVSIPCCGPLALVGSVFIGVATGQVCG